MHIEMVVAAMSIEFLAREIYFESELVNLSYKGHTEDA